MTEINKTKAIVSQGLEFFQKELDDINVDVIKVDDSILIIKESPQPVREFPSLETSTQALETEAVELLEDGLSGAKGPKGENSQVLSPPEKDKSLEQTLKGKKGGLRSSPPPLPQSEILEKQKAEESAKILYHDLNEVRITELGKGKASIRKPGELNKKGLENKETVKSWIEKVFDKTYLNTFPSSTKLISIKEADFIEKSLQLKSGDSILDLGCGFGRHSIELAKRNFRVVGLDISVPLLEKALEEAKKQRVNVEFIHRDMRELRYKEEFSSVISFSTSFGYYDDNVNFQILEGIHRALKPKGKFLIETLNRDFFTTLLPARVFWEGVECMLLEEVDFHYKHSRLVSKRSIVLDQGEQIEQDIMIRLYSLHELEDLLKLGGFNPLEISGSIASKGCFFGLDSPRLIILAEKI